MVQDEAHSIFTPLSGKKAFHELLHKTKYGRSLGSASTFPGWAMLGLFIMFSRLVPPIEKKTTLFLRILVFRLARSVVHVATDLELTTINALIKNMNKMIGVATLCVAIFSSGTVFSLTPDQEIAKKRYYTAAFSGFNGIQFQCRYNNTASFSQKICERARTDFRLICGKYSIQFKLIDTTVSWMMSTLQLENPTYIPLILSIEETESDKKVDIKAIYANLSFQLYYSGIVDGDATEGSPYKFPRSGELELSRSSGRLEKPIAPSVLS